VWRSGRHGPTGVVEPLVVVAGFGLTGVVEPLVVVAGFGLTGVVEPLVVVAAFVARKLVTAVALLVPGSFAISKVADLRAVPPSWLSHVRLV
jgi:hypothetical protein